MEETGVLLVTAYVDIAEADKSQWIARCSDPAGSPFAGLFALGADFRAARKALAATVWAAVSGGSTPIKPADVQAVRVLALTRKTFGTDELAGVTP